MWIQYRRLSLGNLNASLHNNNNNAPSPSHHKRRFNKDFSITSVRAWTVFLLFFFIYFLPNLFGTCEASPPITPSFNKVITDNQRNITDGFFANNPNVTTGKVNRLKGVRRTSRQHGASDKTETEYLDGKVPGPIIRNATARYWGRGPCTCWNTTDGGITLEVECKCSGPNFTKLSTFLPLNVQRLTVEHAEDFTTLSNEDLRPYADTLSELVLTELPQFKGFKKGTFYGMRNLNTIYIHGAHSLTNISDDVFNVFLPKLKLIRITYSSLEVAPNLSKLHLTDALHMVELENSKIAKIIPGSFHNLKTEHLSLSYNELTEIGPKAFEGATIARLGLNGNRQLTTLDPDSFLGIDSLRVLDLSETSITYLPTHGLKGLETLRLEKVWTLTVIPSIYHFQNLKEASLTFPYHCCAFEHPETHDPVAFQAYQEYVRSAVQQLCDKATGNTTEPTITNFSGYQALEVSNTNNQFTISREKRQIPKWKTDVISSAKYQSKLLLGRKRRSIGTTGKAEHPERIHVNPTLDDVEIENSGQYQQDSYEADEPGEHYQEHEHLDSFDPFVFDPEKSFGAVFNPNEMEKESEITGGNPWGHASEEEFGVFHPSVTPSPTVYTLCGNVAVKKPPKVYCKPIPDAFNPCEDIMGSLWLRGAVWIVVALALIGNTAVLVVLLLAPGRMSVQRFLMANLSWADLCMGIYLLMVATEDLVSLGSYFNYAIDWQLGWGCQIAGFLTVFASELSVFTLAIITGERWYALTRAIHLTKRLTIVGAAQLMSLGWICAIILAGLPLIGVSSYSKTSICLPMETNTAGSVVYLSFLLLFNGLAFLLVATAYWQMYRAVAGHGSGAGSSPAASSAADTAIAKKMALLVFTDFACWAPCAFFGLTAVGGYPLIGVTDSKILLVFFYPLNSTLNPYLYAIMTKQYRRDLLLLLSRHGMCTRRAARYKTGAASTNNTLQTMQTVLRLGSMTETKVSQPNNNSPNGGARVSVGNVGVGGNDSKTGVQLPNNNITPTVVALSKDLESSRIFDHPLLPPISNASRGQDGLPKLPPHHSDEDDNLNGVNGRIIAETSFISVPYSSSSLSSLGKSGGGNPNKHMKLVNQDSSQTTEDEHDLDHEISENTPFCRTTTIY